MNVSKGQKELARRYDELYKLIYDKVKYERLANYLRGKTFLEKIVIVFTL